MFLPIKSDNGAVLPWEYMPAEAGTYVAGQLLAVDATTGYLEPIAADLVTTPPYLCMADIKVETAGTPIPVTRVSKDYIYETTLAEATSTSSARWRAAASRSASRPAAAAHSRWSPWTARPPATLCAAAGCNFPRKERHR